MVSKMILVAMMTLALVCPARAQQTLRRFNADDYSNELSPMVGTPLYDVSDHSAIRFDFNGSKDIVPIITFDWNDPVDGQDAIVGMVSCNLYLGSQTCLILSASETLKSFIELDRSQGFKPFRLPVPDGFKGGKLTLSLQTPGVVDGQNHEAAIANVRLVRGVSTEGKPESPAPPFTGCRLPPADLQINMVRDFAGNDFDSHFVPSAQNSDLSPLNLNIFMEAITVIANTAPTGSPRTIPVLALDDPPINQSDYAIAGTVSYGGVEGENDLSGYAYLEMQSDFADGTSEITRTLADSGPLRIFRGRSGSRSFLLPVHSVARHPTRIRMNLVMSDRGTVSLSPLKLVQYSPVVATNVAGVPFWFNPRYFWIGVMVLPFYVLVVALEPLVRRGRARKIVMGWIWISFALAQLCLAWGMAAVGHGISLKEVGPMIAIDMLVLLSALFASRRMPRRYRDVELKRMQLMDAV